jgi:hypothetical protein
LDFGVLWYLGYCEYPTIGRFGGPKTDPTKTWYPGPQTVPAGDLQRRGDLEEPSRKIRRGYFKAPRVAGGGFPGRARLFCAA